MADFIIGIIVGLLLGVALTIWAEFMAIEKQHLKEFIGRKLPSGKTQFIESTSFKEKWDSAENVEDILEN
jgi:ABC-type lipoprotein release transport system permease subunit